MAAETLTIRNSLRLDIGCGRSNDTDELSSDMFGIRRTSRAFPGSPARLGTLTASKWHRFLEPFNFGAMGVLLGASQCIAKSPSLRRSVVGPQRRSNGARAGRPDVIVAALSARSLLCQLEETRRQPHAETFLTLWAIVTNTVS